MSEPVPGSRRSSPAAPFSSSLPAPPRRMPPVVVMVLMAKSRSSPFSPSSSEVPEPPIRTSLPSLPNTAPMWMPARESKMSAPSFRLTLPRRVPVLRSESAKLESETRPSMRPALLTVAEPCALTAKLGAWMRPPLNRVPPKLSTIPVAPRRVPSFKTVAAPNRLIALLDADWIVPELLIEPACRRTVPSFEERVPLLTTRAAAPAKTAFALALMMPVLRMLAPAPDDVTSTPMPAGEKVCVKA